MLKVLAAIAVVALGALAAGWAAVWSGFPDVAATSPHWRLTEWILSTTMEKAVRSRAERLEAPSFLEEEARVRAGAAAYDSMCASCHGAPGVKPGLVARGLNPAPPELAEVVERWTPESLFWITKHGIRMTGMPAFGPTHRDDELWEIVAFARRMPRMRAAEYLNLVDSWEGNGEGHAHPHEHRH